MRGEWDKVNNDVLWSEDNPKRQLIVQAARARLWQVVNELREIVGNQQYGLHCTNGYRGV